ncbi:uncharacterized protein LOC134249885 [Saccostrea cucullata]|uniref:uncharacterized protein LOC134249885 n=1 Tax=Saccostrea cuccullata TaxID=36930 RepID=UPI002ED5BFA5
MIRYRTCFNSLVRHLFSDNMTRENMISFTLLLLVSSLHTSFGDTCEERLSKLETIIEKLEPTGKAQFAEKDTEYGVFSESSLRSKEQRLEDKGLRMEKRIQNMEMFLEKRIKTLEEKIESNNQKMEEKWQEKLRNMEEKVKDFNDQKIKIKVLEAKVAELEMENKKQQSFDEELMRKESVEKDLGTFSKAIASAKDMKNMKFKQMAPSNILQTSYSKVFGNTGNETSLVHQREVKQRKSLISAQKRLLTGIQPTSSPFPDVVAFSSYISTHETHLTEDHTIKFDKIVTNIGNHYNPHSGLFTAPQHGVYVFTWSLYCAVDGYIFSHLVVNSNVVGAMFTTAQGATNYRATTWTVVVEVNKDDVVYIRTLPNGNSHSGSLYSGVNYRSSFNGWRLN